MPPSLIRQPRRLSVRKLSNGGGGALPSASNRRAGGAYGAPSAATPTSPSRGQCSSARPRRLRLATSCCTVGTCAVAK
eukprot:199283-Prymnesium_polylepis.1